VVAVPGNAGRSPRYGPSVLTIPPRSDRQPARHRPSRRAAAAALVLPLPLALAVALPAVATPGTTAAPAGARLVNAPLARPASPAAARAARAVLASTASRAFGRLRGASVSGYAVVDGLGVVIDRRSGLAVPPASTQKLFTGGAALLTLGASARFTTAVRRTGSEGAEPPPPSDPGVPPPCSPDLPPEQPCLVGAPPAQGRPAGPPPASDGRGVLHGDLVVVAAGDPTLTSADLRQLADDVRVAGVRTVTGGLWLDVSAFDTQRGARGWKAGYVGGDAAPLSAFMLDGNRASRSRAYLADPSPDNLARVRATLARAGVTVRGPSAVGAPPTTAEIARHDSVSLGRIVRDMSKRSDNTYAEVLLKDLGATTGAGSTAAGTALVAATVRGLGVLPGRAADGSGLSTLDRVSAAAEVEWLRALDATPAGGSLRRALPVSCTDGTLAGRLCGGAVGGRVQAKTGTLDHSAALAGWTTTRGGRTVWFSFLVDRTDVSAARAAIDAVVAALAAARI